MTGDQVVSLAQARVKSTSTIDTDWDTLLSIVLDEIFGTRDFRFSRDELSYTHTAGTFKKTFNGSSAEKALKEIISIRSYPVGVPSDVEELDFMPLQLFMTTYPDFTEPGIPCIFTEIVGADGNAGMEIGIYPQPSTDHTVEIKGIFIPASVIDATEIDFLPRPFHWILIHGLASLVAGQDGQTSLQKSERALFDMGLAKLIAYDARAAKHRLLKRSIEESDGPRPGPFFPSNFPKPWAR